jgi:hypothetical protein
MQSAPVVDQSDAKRKNARELGRSFGASRLGRTVLLIRGLASDIGELLSSLAIRLLRVAAGLLIAAILLWPASYVVAVLGRPLAGLSLGALLGAAACGLISFAGFFAAWEVAFGASHKQQ